MILKYCEDTWALLRREKQLGKTIVITNGVFDILHAGHIHSLREAKKCGNILVVAVNSDDSVKRLKGSGRPIVKAADRMVVLDALRVVDFVIEFTDDTPEELICQIVPDVLVKGGDYEVEEIAGYKCVQESGGVIAIIPLLDGMSSTGIMKEVVDKASEQGD